MPELPTSADVKERLTILLSNQVEFQLLVGMPIGSEEYKDKVRMSEIYIFKAVEELMELRRTIPSTMNPWAKNQPKFKRERLEEELCDVVLFIINFCLIWGLSPTRLLEILEQVQSNNFAHLETKLKIKEQYVAETL